MPRQLYGGKQKYLTLGLDDTPTNRTYADGKKSQIELDILSGNFDPTLAKYRQQRHLRVVDAFSEPIKNLSLDELWERYTEFRSQQVSATTLKLNYARVASHIKKLPTKNLNEAIAIRDCLIQSNSAYTAKRILVQLAACCKWAAKSQIISDNPFAQMATEIRVSDDNKAEKIDPFSREERDIVIEAFENHPKYKHYAPFVKFLFWTGCRTSASGWIAMEAYQ